MCGRSEAGMDGIAKSGNFKVELPECSGTLQLGRFQEYEGIWGFGWARLVEYMWRDEEEVRWEMVLG